MIYMKFDVWVFNFVVLFLDILWIGHVLLLVMFVVNIFPVFFRCISDNDVICDWRSWCYLTKVLLCVKYLFVADNATTNTVYSCKKKRCQSNLAWYRIAAVPSTRCTLLLWVCCWAPEFVNQCQRCKFCCSRLGYILYVAPSRWDCSSIRLRVTSPVESLNRPLHAC